jgi:phospholipase/lecithinase/hemolysin
MMAMNMNSNQSAKEQKIRRIALAYVEQIERLQKIGAKKILVSTAPKIGDIPEFYNTSSRDQANHLSELLEQEVSQQIKQRFNDNQVAFVSLSEILNQELNKWPQQRQHQACVRDIASDYFNLEHFILHDGELTIKFINDCTQSALTNGSFVYYDGFHGTDKLYQLIARHLHQRHQYTDAMSPLS